MPNLCQNLHDVVSSACDEASSLTHAQVKELLKLGLMSIRQTKKVTPTSEELLSLWDQSLWGALASKLAASDRFKASTGLQAMAKQMVQIAANGDKDRKTSTKRKLDAVDKDTAEATDSPANAKRKKVKKPKA